MMTTDLSSSMKQAMCVDMVVGPNVETISASPIIQQQSEDCHLPEGENCFGLPYQDHNYGAPLPSKYNVTPISVFVKHGRNNGVTLNDNISTTNSILVEQARTAPPLRKNGGIRTSYSLKNSIHKKENLPSETIGVGDVTRCICGYTHDDGYMIACDKCKVWQHIDCMNIDRNKIPDAYLCDICNPRELSKSEAMQLQAKKLHDFSMVSELSSGAESGDDRDISRLTYKAVQSTPTSLTITSNRTSKRSESVGAGKKRKRSKDDDNKRPTKKTYTIERKRSRSISKSTLNDEEQYGSFHWARKLKEWNESYQEINENLYTAELLQAVLSASRMREHKNKEESVLTQLRSQLVKVQQLRSKVLALEDVTVSQPIIEVMGSYMLSKQSEAAKPEVFQRPYPHLFFYNGFDGLEVVVDSRVFGNTSRYLRRSCCPNSEVRHVVEGDQLHLFVYSKDNISNGSEITIPYDFKYQNCLYDVSCACEKDKDCPVYEFTNMRDSNHNSKSKSKDSETGRVSPLRFSITRIQDSQINGFSGSDHETQSNNDADSANNNPENQRKKSREDRKVEAYMRAFARLEKKEKTKNEKNSFTKRPNDPKTTDKDNTSVSSTSSTISKTSLSISLPSVDDTASSVSLPARRTNRRRSTKGSRRSIKKTRMPSYEGVLSPLSVENDSNHSMDVAPLTPDVPSMGAITEDLGRKGITEALSESTPACDSEMEFATGEISPHSNRSESFSIKTSQSSISRTSSTNSRSNSSTLEYNITTTKRELLSPIESGLVPAVESMDELPPLTIECVSQEPPVVVSTSSGSKVSKKKTTTEASTNSSKPTETTDSSSTAPNVPPIMSFTNWEFRPGVPSGHVHIRVGNFPKRRHPKEMHIKKNWLNFAKEDNLLTEKTVDMETETLKFTHKVGLKKHILKTYLKDNDEKSNVTQNVTENNDSAKTDPDIAAKDPHIPPPSDDGAAPTFPLVSSGILPQPPEHCSPTPRAYPAIVYESLSEDEQEATNLCPAIDTQPTDPGDGAGNENKPPCHEETYYNPLHVNGEMSTNHPQTFERDLPPKHSTILEDNQSSAKKKVTLQEYLKRNKEQRKSVANEQPESKPVVVTSTCINTTSSPSSTTIQTPAITTPVVSTTSSVSQPSSLTSSQTSSPISVAEQNKETKVENEPEVKREKENKTNDMSKKKEEKKSPIEIAKPPKIDDKTLDISTLVNLLSNEALPTNVKELLKTLPLASTGSPKEKSNAGIKSVEDGKLSNNDKGSSKSLSTDHKDGLLKGRGSSPVRPAVERSNSSPGVRQFQQPRQGGTPSNHPVRKIGGSQHSSPSNRQSTPSSSGPRKGFTSPPQGASPRLIRGHSGSSLSSHSPTPTIYDRRHRTDYSSRDSASSGKSRHSSGASGDGSNIKSPKSSSSGDSIRASTKHSISSSDPKLSSRHQDTPQKVSSITPDVPGQPIPSLARGPGTNRVPQVVYNRRSSPPRMDTNPQSWEPYPHDLPTPGRSMKDVPYDRQNPYHYPPRLSPPPGPDRNSRDKYYDRYEPPPQGPRRREEDPHSGYYHHRSYYPPDYRGDRPIYYSPREGRPPSPVPPPRPGSDYYHRSSGYYPPQDYRR